MADSKIDKLQNAFDLYFPWTKEICHRSNPEGWMKGPALIKKIIAVAAAAIFEAVKLFLMTPVYLINYCWSGRNVEVIDTDQITDEESELADEAINAFFEENKKVDEVLNKHQLQLEETLKKQREELERLRNKFPETYAKISSESSTA